MERIPEKPQPLGDRLNARLTTPIAWFLAGILLYAGIDHCLTFNRFLLSIAKYRIVPPGVDVGILGFGMIVMMIFSGLALMDKPIRQYGAILATLLFLTFFIATLQAWFREIDIECGCALSGRSIDWIAVLKPLLLGISSATVAIFAPPKNVNHAPPDASTTSLELQPES